MVEESIEGQERKKGSRHKRNGGEAWAITSKNADIKPIHSRLHQVRNSLKYLQTKKLVFSWKKAHSMKTSSDACCLGLCVLKGDALISVFVSLNYCWTETLNVEWKALQEMYRMALTFYSTFWTKGEIVCTTKFDLQNSLLCKLQVRRNSNCLKTGFEVYHPRWTINLCLISIHCYFTSLRPYLSSVCKNKDVKSECIFYSKLDRNLSAPICFTTI